MATGTIIPSPKFTGFDANGNPLSGGKLYTYVAGTPSDPQTTYSNVELTSANANPVVLDSAGVATVFVSAGTSFKYVLKDSADVLIWSADNIGAVPKSTATLDVTVTAGEAISALDAVYISQGDGSKTSGRAYQTDADETYSSSLAVTIGLAPAAIASGETGSIRLGGALGGYTGLTAGATQYVSATPGALTGTAPTNSRIVGQAVSTTEVMLASNAVGDSLAAIRAGGIAIASQAANEIIYASSATQLTRSSTFTYDGSSLGVGVTSPAFYVTAIGSGATDQYTINSTHATYTGSALKVGAVRAATSAYNLIYTATGTSADGSSGTQSFVVRGDGTVTIAGLEGVGTSAVRSTIHLKPGGNNWEDGLLLEHNSGDTGWNFHPENNAANALFVGYNANTAASLAGQTATAVMVLTSAGNVGVGTSSPGTATVATGTINSANSIRCWAKVDVTSGTPVLDDSYNVASLTDVAVGKTRITFSTAMPHANYAALVTFCDNFPKLAVVQNELEASVEVWTYALDGSTLEDLDWSFAIVSD
jgi:hypothetical protein